MHVQVDCLRRINLKNKKNSNRSPISFYLSILRHSSAYLYMLVHIVYNISYADVFHIWQRMLHISLQPNLKIFFAYSLSPDITSDAASQAWEQGHIFPHILLTILCSHHTDILQHIFIEFKTFIACIYTNTIFLTLQISHIV